MHGWTGSILIADLTTRTQGVLHPSEETFRLFPGGRSLAGHLLRPRVGLPWNHPDMPVIFMTGSLTGTAAPCSGRCHVASRSPLTGAPGDASTGGNLGPALKAAGWDGLMLTGASDALLGLEITSDGVRFVEAGALRGADTEAVFTALPGWDSVACVGPAAENGVLSASIVVDRLHAAERCGLGLCLATKGCKFLAVSGERPMSVADPGGLAAANHDILRLFNASPALRGPLGFHRFGTAALCDLTAARSMMPTDNFRHTRFEQAGGCNAPALAARLLPASAPCPSCPVGCVQRTGDGRLLPGFDALSHFTALIRNPDPVLAVEAVNLCARLGLDPVSAAVSLASFAEITGRALGPERLLGLLEDTALGRGDGRLLGRGARRLAEELGKPDAAMTIKGLEIPACDPRGAYGLALAYAVSTRGACHQRALPLAHELLRKPVATDRFSFLGKARIIKLAEDQMAAADSLPACAPAFLAAGLEEYARAFTAVTGLSVAAGDLALAGERCVYQERLMLAELGFTAQDDDLPERFFREPGDQGEDFEVPPLDREEFLAARARYYRVRGLDDNGLPRRDTAEALGLTWTAS
ncbi:MAG: aldehyde ferredoxin oxidoreductase family protein [Desulfovibrio aminophilus]|uniref:aldehyde ferredoxin oxidoreductase family protein n=1 Tax=Desulfovibrio aminophilus TaxID=81425 RepID=UPI0039E8A48A